MKLVKAQTSDPAPIIGILDGDQIRRLRIGPGEKIRSLADLLDQPSAAAAAASLETDEKPISLDKARLLAPIDAQEVWAAGVTYRRSKTARMEESEGAALFYDKIYEADRPELFFKATPYRVVGPEQPVRIRRDAHWNVPEPELALVINARQELVGFTIGNDMSSRDIEGENPLYLPQAKVYDGCCALGPAVVLAKPGVSFDHAAIQLNIRRHGKSVFHGEANTSQMARTFADLVGWLGRETTFPHGVILLTGTGIVPGDNFTLHPGDRVEITIDGIGTLANTVVQG